ncbi:MAG: hypothetical protein C4K48_11340 [Candidatus Thorarchaeota archaeon]|nr:MAG: hypothetical protein C4K48_11340 [Candidatus Thorarchaeota archaeon]
MSYLYGVFLAIASGISNNFGTLLQKKVVNDLPTEAKEQRFFRSLVKKRMWLLGLLFQIAIGTAFFMLAQVYIGPALIPGLMAVGLIVLAIGSVKLIGETLTRTEVIGITLIMTAIFTIAFSGLVIDIVVFDFLETGFLTRVALFTSALIVMILILEASHRRWTKIRAIARALMSGLFISMSNYWIAILMGTIVHVFDGTFVLLELGLFSISAAILVLDNIFALGTLQSAFLSGQANLIIPIQQVPIQIIPGLVFLLIFFLPAPTALSLVLFFAGVGLIVMSSFLLGRRQVALEAIK